MYMLLNFHINISTNTNYLQKKINLLKPLLQKTTKLIDFSEELVCQYSKKREVVNIASEISNDVTAMTIII